MSNFSAGEKDNAEFGSDVHCNNQVVSTTLTPHGGSTIVRMRAITMLQSESSKILDKKIYVYGINEKIYIADGNSY